MQPGEITNITIGEREAAYIPESAFAAASKASEALLDAKETSSPSLNERRQQIIEALQKALDIQHWIRANSVHISILEAAEALYVQGKWIEDEKLLRNVQLFTLFSLDPKGYSPDDPDVKKRNGMSLWRALNGELKKRGKHELAKKLKKIQENPSGQYKAVKT